MNPVQFYEFGKNKLKPVPEGRLLSYYKLDTNADDSVSNNNGTITNASFVTGKINQGLQFVNVNAYVDIPNNLNDFSFTLGNGQDVAFSISMWVQFSSISTIGNWLINKRNTINGGDEWQFLYSPGKITFQKFDKISNSIYRATEFNFTPSLNSWYHLVYTDNGTKINGDSSLYVNGEIILGTHNNNGVYRGMNAGVSKTRIGVAAWNADTKTQHKGLIDEVGIWKYKALSLAEVQDIYNSGLGKYPF